MKRTKLDAQAPEGKTRGRQQRESLIDCCLIDFPMGMCYNLNTSVKNKKKEWKENFSVAPWGSFQFDPYSYSASGFPPWIAESPDPRTGRGRGRGSAGSSSLSGQVGPAGRWEPALPLTLPGHAPGTRSPEQAPPVPTPQSPLSHHALLPEPRKATGTHRPQESEDEENVRPGAPKRKPGSPHPHGGWRPRCPGSGDGKCAVSPLPGAVGGRSWFG